MPVETLGEFSVKRISILDENANIDNSLMPSLSDDDIRTIYWHMCLSRVLNTKMLNLQKQGRLGTFASTLGQEGCQAACAYAIKDEKNVWLAPTFRENIIMLARGAPILKLLLYWGGNEIGSKLGYDMRILPVSIPVGSQSLHAVGLAMSMNIKNERGAAIALMGDGATSEGEHHEALNMAGVFKAPVIFFCQNNQYAISVPRKKQTASKTLAEKAFGYAFEGIQVDGNDIFAVYKVVKDALNKALNGDGPTFIEAVTYRLDHHTTADDWKKYRAEDEVRQWEKKDPILRLRNYMTKKGIWNDEHEKGMLADAEKKVNEAVSQYENYPKPKPEEIFDYLYDKLPQHLQEQKDRLIKFWSEQR